MWIYNEKKSIPKIGISPLSISMIIHKYCTCDAYYYVSMLPCTTRSTNVGRFATNNPDFQQNDGSVINNQNVGMLS